MLRLGLALLCAVPALGASRPPKRMLRLTAAWTGVNVPHDAYAERPRTYTRATNRYCRMDAEVHSERGTQQTVIINEPDLWQVERTAKTARHSVDPGPAYDCRLPIFSFGAEAAGPELALLEYGREPEFFRARRAKRREDGSYELRLGAARLVLTFREDRKAPAAVELLLRGSSQRVTYLEWEDGLPFDAALFAAPRGVRMIEAAVGLSR